MSKIIISKNNYELLMKGTIIDGKCYTISLIKFLLNKYYLNLIMLLNNSDDLVIIIKNHTYLKRIKIDDIFEFINVMYKLYNNNYLTKDEEMKVLFLKSKANYKRKILFSKYEFEYYYNGCRKICSTNYLINLFSKESNCFKNIVNNIKENNRDELMILLKKFALFLNNRTENANIKNNINYILSITNEYEIVDKIKIKKKPSYIDKIKIDESFGFNIIKNIPFGFTKLEIAIYIYIKLCSLLTHDVNDIYRNSYNINHKNINRLKDINRENNIIVCYEFVGIFAKLLELFNIDYEISGDQVYGRGHTYINIIYKESIICFDSTKGIVDCDLTKVKNNIRVCNIIPIKANPYMIRVLNNSVNNVYDYLDKYENKHYYFENDFVRLNKENKCLSMEDKINLFFEKIFNTQLQPVDNIKYIYLLRKCIFEHNEVYISIIERKNLKNNSKLAIIFSFNINNSFIYYLYEYPNVFKYINKEVIEELIINDKFKYIKYVESKIPGINEEEKRLYKK